MSTPINKDAIRKFIRGIGGRQVIYFFAITSFSAVLMVTVNLYTIKINSCIRAYINGESMYAKGEKDAAQSLILYLHSRNEEDYEHFVKALATPINDGHARINMNRGARRELVKDNFILGKNHPDDVDNLIWLYENFKNLPFMKKCINIWSEGDSLIEIKNNLGVEAHSKISNNSFNHNDEIDLMQRILSNNNELSQLESLFSYTLGETARALNVYLIIFNIVIILLLFILVYSYAASILIKLRSRNYELKLLNVRMDSMIYSVSHDLKSPIASVQGLINLCQIEGDSRRVNDYLTKMSAALEKLNSFIQQLIESKKNESPESQSTAINLSNLVDQSFQQHRYMKEAAGIVFSKEIQVESFNSDEYLLKTILDNLISNSIKYHDKTKQVREVKVHAKKVGNDLILDISDNGQGIEAAKQGLIFEKYFTTDKRQVSSGLGLSIVKESVSKLGGVIQVHSVEGTGTRFIVTLPLSV
ncbi:MAG TPA: HAMP domain-containing sensor histidine kinase [Cyclobacteriaceae bacterium]|nr:HAMP domain-containing sensor histidine kinase [Cyclobacteriaceae bacterium]